MNSYQPRSTTGASILGRWAIGIAAGVVLSLLTSLIPVVTIVVIGVVVLATWISVLRRDKGDRHWSLAGLSLGSGCVLLYAAASTFQSCVQTDNFCGNANVTPLFAFALFGLASGVIASIVAFASRR